MFFAIPWPIRPTPANPIFSLAIAILRNSELLFFYRAGHRRHVVFDEKGIEDDERQRARERARHQRAPAIDVAVDEFVHDRDRHRFMALAANKGKRIDKFFPSPRETK